MAIVNNAPAKKPAAKKVAQAELDIGNYFRKNIFLNKISFLSFFSDIEAFFKVFREALEVNKIQIPAKYKEA